MGIAQGMLCDGQLSDVEVGFLQKWLESSRVVVESWPGNVLHARIQAVVADGIITPDERNHLVATLADMLGGSLERLHESSRATRLCVDTDATVTFDGAAFCLTGDFVFAPRDYCHEQIKKRGGIVKTNVSNKLQYLVIGSLGSPEWSHGSFGLKVEKAMELKQSGVPVLIIDEDMWVAAL